MISMKSKFNFGPELLRSVAEGLTSLLARIIHERDRSVVLGARGSVAPGAHAVEGCGDGFIRGHAALGRQGGSFIERVIRMARISR